MKAKKSGKWLALLLTVALVIGVVPFVGAPETATVEAAETTTTQTDPIVTEITFNAAGETLWFYECYSSWFDKPASLYNGTGKHAVYTVSFDYYLEGAAVTATDVTTVDADVHWPAGYQYYKSGDTMMRSGKNDFSIVVESRYHADNNKTLQCMPMFKATGAAKLYLWNFKVALEDATKTGNPGAGSYIANPEYTSTTVDVKAGNALGTYRFDKEIPEQNDPMVTKLVFSEYGQWYRFPTPTVAYEDGTHYTLSFSYYYEPGTLSKEEFSDAACVTIYNNGSKSSAYDYQFFSSVQEATPWGETTSKATDVSADFHNLEYVSGRKVYKGFVANEIRNMTLNVTVGAGDTFVPTLYSYGTATMYIWNIRVVANHNTISLNDEAVGGGSTKEVVGFLSNQPFATELAAYYADTSVTKVSFGENGGSWDMFSARLDYDGFGRETFGFTSEEYHNIRAQDKRVLFRLTFDYFLYSTQDIDLDAQDGVQLGWTGGFQNEAGDQTVDGKDNSVLVASADPTKEKQNKKLSMFVLTNSTNQGANGLFIRPTVTTTVAATLYVWNVRLELLPEDEFGAAGSYASQLYPFVGNTDFSRVDTLYTPYGNYQLNLSEKPEEFTQLYASKTDGVEIVKGLSATNYQWHTDYNDYRVVEVKFDEKETKSLDWWMMSAHLKNFGYSDETWNAMFALDRRNVRVDYTVSFDYYLSAPDDVTVMLYEYGANSAGGELNFPGGCAHYNSGDTALINGKWRHFNMTMSTFYQYEARPTFHASGAAKLYIWNVQVECNGRVYTGWMQETGDGKTQKNFSSNDGSVKSYSAARPRQITKIVDNAQTPVQLSDYNTGVKDYYDNKNKRILKDLTIPTNKAASQPDSKVFVGWLDDQGDPYYLMDMLSPYHYDLLREQWYDFYTKGTQIRDTEVKPGLRFCFGIDPRFEENMPDLVKYAVVIPESLRVYSNNHVLTDKAEFTYGTATYKAETTACPLYFSPQNNMYTLVIVGSADKYSNRVYAARGMLTFTSLNGHENWVAYTNDTNEYTQSVTAGTMAKSYNGVVARIKQIAAEAASA